MYSARDFKFTLWHYYASENSQKDRRVYAFVTRRVKRGSDNYTGLHELHSASLRSGRLILYGEEL